jgi:hypothetical protein
LTRFAHLFKQRRPTTTATGRSTTVPRVVSREWAERHSRELAGVALVALWLLVGTALAVWFSGRIRDWSVMTDELLYAKLATSIADTGSLRPHVHDAPIAVYNQLYPLLLAPLFGTLSPPDAFRAAHVLNAFVMTSAVFPAYLLARQIAGRWWSLAVAALSILVPWMIVTGFLMTEVVAYPAFLWAVLGLQLAIARPSASRDLLAVGALALTVLARTQFAALALALPLAIVGHEVGYARSVRAGMRAAFERHRLLAALYALGAVVLLVAALVDSIGGLLGVYAVTVEEGSLLPSGIWASAAQHLDAVAIGCGLVPFVVGGGWLLASAVRPRTRPEHAFATLVLLTTLVLTFEVASFSVRFGDDAVRDRYLFYVVPLLLAATAAALSTARARDVAIGAGALTAFFAATAAGLPFETFTGVWIDSPASVLNDLLIEQSGSLGTGAFVALLGLFAGIVLVLALLFVSRIPLAVAVVGALALFSILTLRSEVDRVVGSTGLSGRPLAEKAGTKLDWVDGAVPAGEEAALVAFPVSTAWDTTAIRWWDVELWNRRIGRAYAGPDGNFAYTPFSHDELEIDGKAGAVSVDDSVGYAVVAPRDPRFELAGRTVAENVGLEVRALERPYRLLWSTRGLQTDGWTTPGRAAQVRVHGSGPTRVSITLRAPDADDASYEVSVGEVRRAGTLEPASERVERLTVCAPAEVLVTGTSEARIPAVQLSPTVEGTRRVGVLPGPIRVRPLPGGC